MQTIRVEVRYEKGEAVPDQPVLDAAAEVLAEFFSLLDTNDDAPMPSVDWATRRDGEETLVTFSESYRHG